MKRGPKSRPVEERFLKLIDKNCFEHKNCWCWTGGTYSNGYGTFHFKGKQTGAHRVSWELTNGTIPKGFLILHKCDNRLCVNPNHLFLGSHKDNMQDCIKKRRFVRGENHIHAAFSQDEVNFIRSSNLKQHELAKYFGVVQQTISRVIRGERYGS